MYGLENVGNYIYLNISTQIMCLVPADVRCQGLNARITVDLLSVPTLLITMQYAYYAPPLGRLLSWIVGGLAV